MQTIPIKTNKTSIRTLSNAAEEVICTEKTSNYKVYNGQLSISFYLNDSSYL